MQLQNRRGTIAVLVAVMMTALLAVSAVSIDSSRLHSLRNELQFSADAGAHAGAIQLMEPNDPLTTAEEVAAAYSKKYLAMQGVVQVDSVELGAWDDFQGTFVPGLTPPNAVRVVVSRRAPGLILSHFGVNSPRVRARAVGWLANDTTSSTRRVILAQ
ncbi:MAG TPA: TadG family pilus assembly protein [Gemmatimonadaceae bacterium]